MGAFAMQVIDWSMVRGIRGLGFCLLGLILKFFFSRNGPGHHQVCEVFHKLDQWFSVSYS